VLTVEDSMHRTFSSLLTEHHQNAHCIIVQDMTSKLHSYIKNQETTSLLRLHN